MNDFVRRRGVKALEALARRPELRTPEAQERLAAWLRGEEDRMPRPKIGSPQTIRLDAETLERIDRVAEMLTRPGLEATRTTALRVAIVTGLDALLGDAPATPPGGRGSRRGAKPPMHSPVAATKNRRGS